MLGESSMVLYQAIANYIYFCTFANYTYTPTKSHFFTTLIELTLRILCCCIARDKRKHHVNEGHKHIQHTYAL